MSQATKAPTAPGAHFDELSRHARIDIKALSLLLSRSRASIYRDVACGRLPRPVKFGEGPTAASRWIVGEVRDYLTSQALERTVQSRRRPQHSTVTRANPTPQTIMSGDAP